MTKSSRLVNDAIYKLCEHLEAMNSQKPVVFVVSERRLFLELTQCLLGSQVRHEVALTFASLLEQNGLLDQMREGNFRKNLARRLVVLLKSRQKVKWPGGASSLVRYRFPEHRASSLLSTARQIYGKGASLEILLGGSETASEARNRLIATCFGIGPKQSSLFLRKVGLGSELAILDTHVLYYLRSFWNVDVRSDAVVNIDRYRAYEGTFRRIAEYFGFSVSIVDIAVWATMRALKQGDQREYRQSGIRRTRLDTRGSTNARTADKTIPSIH